jgi:rubrerythrin
MQATMRKVRRAKARGSKTAHAISAARRGVPLTSRSGRAAPAHAARNSRQKGLTETDFPIPPSATRPKVVFLNCHYCGYSPEQVPQNETCPKCGGHSWDRFYISAKLVSRMAK